MHDDAEYRKLVSHDAVPLQLAISLARARGEADLTQAQVAERMGTSQSVVARMENGWHLPSLRTIERYARAVGAKVEVRLLAVDPVTD